MLKTRILTAVVLLSAFLSALFYLPPAGWAVFATLIAVLAAWEWGALAALGQGPRIAFGALVALGCAGIAALDPAALGIGAVTTEAAWRMGRWFYLPAAAFWLLVVPLWIRWRWPLPKSVGGLLVGLVLILPTWLAFIQLRLAGALALVAIMATVWLADIAAYFFGRALGKHKLAPAISPGKTWEGAIGGAFAVLVYGFILGPRLPAALSGNYALLFLVLLILAVLSVVGDLFESLLKRQAGLKDSSALLPGHGGVLDRIDSLTSTLPLVALVWLATLH